MIDTVSLGTGLFEIATEEVEGPYEWAVVLADFAADSIDLGVCVQNLEMAL
jgi:hypothetical protein